jgi:hypothetical protein
MSQFRTIVRATPSKQKIQLKSGVFTIGSCFADAIGTRLAESKFSAIVNPFGTTYNPISIHKSILYAINNQLPEPHTYSIRDDIHVNFDFHSDFSALDKGALSHAITDVIGASHYFLKSAQYLLITYGTAWVYAKQESGEIVNNCHKLPQSNFLKRLLSEAEINGSFDALYTGLKKFNPSAKFILTVSPVRHIKDTLELNSVSKSILRTACHSITKNYADTEYFPAFEMMIDDLRDYRFYAADMLHPTEEAENYIWQNFAERYFDEATRQLIAEWTSIRASLNHKPFHPTSKAHQQFLRQTLKKLEGFSRIIDVQAEIAAVQAQLINV